MSNLALPHCEIPNGFFASLVLCLEELAAVSRTKEHWTSLNIGRRGALQQRGRGAS